MTIDIPRGRTLARASLAAVLAAGLAACGGGEGGATAEAAGDTTKAGPEIVLSPADLAPAGTTQLQGGVALTGSLEPFRVVQVKSQVPGVVAGLSVDRGSAVQQGQVLARIEAQGIQSQAGGAAAQVAGAQAALAQANRQLESAKTLYDAGAMSEISYRAAETQVQAARAQVAAARAASAGASEQAGRTRVVSPLTGRVSERVVQSGEAVNVGQVLLTVVDSRALELRGQVPVEQAAAVRQGQPVEFTLNSQPGRTIRGTVSRVDPVADAATRQVGVTLSLPNADGALIGGLFATGRVLTGTTTEAVAVPTAAVRTAGTESFVWVVRNSRAERRVVTLGDRDDARGMVAVAQGLAAGEQVIVAPGEMEAGARIVVRAANNTAPAGGGR
ncbi:efflux RND transporter periplasmic adaptor subunit [Longimicrobium terrae]|uniref:RND family efflux transporter MFP subunit n=1 Tax=Longimicrobium terrae TaxID=1639882 RepID=A0A841GX01_9BACT|nr:efflux RND transporter periplasmic adaptor subunit [Longimicrobium terrae]MBB4634741.1 RND family efflux transporter MFP subunit [Longimicrobium terrae]MBB6069136.1 RND family efflux transporter MFP subunit [Longimicrobium terrae]NNC32047.1 efflux RND transporter periplasmic adaptor subunit [Longimicrobium terrae]